MSRIAVTKLVAQIGEISDFSVFQLICNSSEADKTRIGFGRKPGYASDLSIELPTTVAQLITEVFDSFKPDGFAHLLNDSDSGKRCRSCQLLMQFSDKIQQCTKPALCVFTFRHALSEGQNL